MTSIQKGQVVLLQMIPTGSLRRPAVIIDIDKNISNQILTVVPMTTTGKANTKESKELTLTAKDFVSSNIRHEVCIDCSVVAKVPIADVVGVIGTLSTNTLKNISTLLQ